MDIAITYASIIAAFALVIAAVIFNRPRLLWAAWGMNALALALFIMTRVGVQPVLLGIAVIVAVGSAVFYGVRAVREGLSLPDRSREYDRTIADAQRGEPTVTDSEDTQPYMRPI